MTDIGSAVSTLKLKCRLAGVTNDERARVLEVRLLELQSRVAVSFKYRREWEWEWETGDC